MNPVRKSVFVFSMGIAVLSSCDPGDLFLTEPAASADASPALSVHVGLDARNAPEAASLGWEAGVPSAVVRVHRTDDPYDESYWIEQRTDGVGYASYPDLLAGLYEVEVVRALTSQESAALDSGGPVFAGGERLAVPVDGLHELALSRSVTTGLVFSEIGLFGPSFALTGVAYTDGKFFEVRNESDATIYLDGVLLGISWIWTRSYTWGSCSDLSEFRDDPEGIWSERILRFPGSGSEYPLAPGQVVLIARSARDHRSVHPALLDLSNADFEFPASSGADNPDIPNLADVGVTPLPAHWPTGDSPFYLARPTDLDALPRKVYPGDGDVYVRIPAAAILDAVVNVTDFTKSSYQASAMCTEELNPRFERLPGPALWEDPEYHTAQRRVISYEGADHLQDTNTSMADFRRAPATPGWVPTGPGGS